MHIYCDGGFGNRFNGLIAGSLIAKAAQLTPIIVWPRNNWCRAAYNDIFELPENVLERELKTYLPIKDDFQFFMTEDHLHMGVSNQSPLQTASLDKAVNYLSSSHRDVYFHTPLIPSFLKMDCVLKQINCLPLSKNLTHIAQRFIESRNLTEFFGVHIRKTDFGANSSDDKNLFTLISNCPHKQFFVCSDDEEVEQQFGLLNNVAIYPKRAYVKTLVDGDWNTPTADSSGRVYACNVDRSALSVEDAVIDLLILSHSQIVDTSNSTFRNTAMLLKAARSTNK